MLGRTTRRVTIITAGMIFVLTGTASAGSALAAVQTGGPVITQLPPDLPPPGDIVPPPGGIIPPSTSVPPVDPQQPGITAPAPDLPPGIGTNPGIDTAPGSGFPQMQPMPSA